MKHSLRELSYNVFPKDHQVLLTCFLTIIIFLSLPKSTVGAPFSRVSTRQENINNGSDSIDDGHSNEPNEFLIKESGHDVPILLSDTKAFLTGSNERTVRELHPPVEAQEPGLNVSSTALKNTTVDGWETCDCRQIPFQNVVFANVSKNSGTERETDGGRGKTQGVRLRERGGGKTQGVRLREGGGGKGKEKDQLKRIHQYQDQEQLHHHEMSKIFQIPRNVLEHSADTEVNDKSTVKSHERSQLFKKIEEGIFYWLTETKKQLFLCDSKCDEAEMKRCSCSSSCVALGTCCLNFMDICSRARENHFSLKEVLAHQKNTSSECINSWSVITSCPKQSSDSRNMPDGSVHGKSFRTRGTENDTNPSHNTLLPVDDIPQNDSNDKSIHILTKMMYAIPIVDIETHLSYSNFSVFSCNHINLSRTLFWDTVLPVPDEVVSKLSKFPSIGTFFQIMNLTDMRENFLQPQDFNGQIKNWCVPQSVGACPEDYQDEDIELFCKITFLPVVIDDIEASLPYKNPFCAFCHHGFDITLTPVTLFRSDIGPNNIILRQEVWTSDITVFNRFFGSFRPLWAEIICRSPFVERFPKPKGIPLQFTNVSTTTSSKKKISSDKELTTARSGKSLDYLRSFTDSINEKNWMSTQIDTNLQETERKKGTSVVTRFSTSAPSMFLQQHKMTTEDVPMCSVKKCLVGFDESTGFCGHTVTITLVLPPLRRLLTDNDIMNLTGILKTFFLDLIPFLRDQDKAVGKRNEEVMYGKRYEYTFELQFFSELIIDVFSSEEQTKIIQLFQNGDFPFMEDFHYACARISIEPNHMREQLLCKPAVTLLLIPPGNASHSIFLHDGAVMSQEGTCSHAWVLLLWALLTAWTSIL